MKNLTFLLLLALTQLSAQNEILVNDSLSKSISSESILEQHSYEPDTTLKTLSKEVTFFHDKTLNIFFSEIPSSWIVRQVGKAKYDFLKDPIEKTNPYIFKADVAPYFQFFNNPKSKDALFLTIRVKIRNFNYKEQYFSFSPDSLDNSLPVRTPSYMPSIIYYHRLRDWPRDSKKIETKNAFPRQKIIESRDQWFVFGCFEHHSNGQDGSTLDSLTPYNNPYRDLNVINGSFGKNLYCQVGTGFSRRMGSPSFKFSLNPFYPRNPCKGIFQNCKNAYWFTNKTFHFSSINNISLKFEQQIVKYSEAMEAYVPEHTLYLKYSRHLFNIGEDKEFNEVQRFAFTAEYAMDNDIAFIQGNFLRKFNLDFEMDFKIPFSPQTNLFLNGGYYGMDNYNIFIEDTYWYFNIGISVYSASFDFK